MIQKSYFGTLPCGREVMEYVLSNGSIASFSVLDYGGIIKNVWVQDKNGQSADVICGFDGLEGYLTSGGYQGALIGRVCNRIENGRFSLDGVEYRLNCNDGLNTLHGGVSGFNTKMWTVREVDNDRAPSLVLNYVSPHMEENFPGELSVTVTYTLTAEGGLSIHYHAVTNQATPVNLTNHAYFNLGGFDSGTIHDHTLWLDADRINSLNHQLIPDGDFIDVVGTPYDFREERSLGEGIRSDYGMIVDFQGYDNNFCFVKSNGTMPLRAVLRHPQSGRSVKTYTDQPCVQVYTANMINPDDPPFKGGVPQRKHCAVCLETQAMPNSVNLPHFTNVILRPGDVYDSTTVYLFENK